MNKRICIGVSILLGIMLQSLKAKELQIDANFPGGNIKVLSIEGDTVRLKEDLRDTEGNWFNWSFRVKGAEGRTLNFIFARGVIAARGPAVSTDGGETWRWLGELGFSDKNFQYQFGKKDKEVYFGVGMNYTEKNLTQFLKKYKKNPYLKVETLCKTKKGRNVELLRIYDSNKTPDFKIFLSSRHHCGEMMATYSLEGIIDAALSDTEDGRWLRERADFFIVPLVDKDGVEDGDQGKNRRPHDHNRDYIQKIYPEIKAITEQVPQWQDGKPLFFLDMHCPGHRGGAEGGNYKKGTNEYVYFPGKDPTVYVGFDKKLQRFGEILEAEKKGVIPYKASFNLPYGVSWNTSANLKTSNLRSCDQWGATLPNAIFAGAIEVPFANASGVVVDVNSARELGNDLARAIRVYLESYNFNAFAQDNRWSEERANNWYKSFKWLNGVNYIPSDAINYTAMWDKTSFNPALIDKELALAQSIGLNCVRVVLQYAVYADDPAYFLSALERFLEICDKHDITVMPTFFDDCTFGENADPVIGKQDEPRIGWYAWAWSPSPGHTMVVDESRHPLLEKYVKDVLRKFKNDPRVLLWDLYNEPTNTKPTSEGYRSIPLVKSVFVWARAINPSQPLTVGTWNGNKELNEIVFAQSDIISFHNYGSKEAMAKQIQDLRNYNRPLICTEWMNRPLKSTVEDVMPVLKNENVGGFLWGLVNGKTQTHLTWGHRPEKLPYTGVWQHDLYHSDFKPYNMEEIEIIKNLNK
ncbi:glycoside hydrolase family 5 [Candidatus Symbiothrix dinenymphae]|nr:glycoside hydrolase family 5 [Candidatus Symbiothrix dinenymphae]